MRNQLRILICIILCLGIASCASRPEETQTSRTILPIEAVDPSLPNDAPVQRSRDDNHTILALSAGGQMVHMGLVF